MEQHMREYNATYNSFKWLYLIFAHKLQIWIFNLFSIMRLAYEKKQRKKWIIADAVGIESCRSSVVIVLLLWKPVINIVCYFAIVRIAIIFLTIKSIFFSIINPSTTCECNQLRRII